MKIMEDSIDSIIYLKFNEIYNMQKSDQILKQVWEIIIYKILIIFN